MPLEYDSGMTATEMAQEASWAMYQRERNRYARGVGPRGPKFMPLKRWKKDMDIVDKPVMLQKIEALPALTQARVLTELQNDPSQVTHIKMLLAEPDPTAAILKDQEKVALNVVKPGLYPEAKGKWPVFQAYYRNAYGIAVKRAATRGLSGMDERRLLPWQSFYGIDDLGKERLSWEEIYGMGDMGAEIVDEASKLLQSQTGTKTEAKKEEDWNAVLKTASGILQTYGVPALQSNVKAYAQKKEGKKEGKLAAQLSDQITKQTVKKEVEAAQVEQATVQAEVTPTTSPPPPKGLGRGTKIGLGVGALLLAGFAGYMVLRRK